MSGFINKLYLLILSLLAALSISCSGGNKGPSFSYIINSTQSYRSNDLIDNFPASELYFRLDSQSRCITINIVAQEHEVLGTTSLSKIFFILERELDISLFPGRNESTFIELGRNFDNNWEHSPSVRICTITTNPVHKVEPDILYRIRFTNFDRRDTKMKVTILGNSRVRFLRQ